MSLWRQLAHGFHSLLRRAAKDRDIEDEVGQYFEEATADWKSRGLSDEDARQAAGRELGTLTAVQEQVRSYGWENAIRALFSDLRFGARQLRKNPGFKIGRAHV